MGMVRGLFRAAVLLVVLAGGMPAGGARAEAPVVLTVAGPQGTVSFTLAALEALPSVRITTATPWHEGARTYTGPRLALVLATAGVDVAAGAEADREARLRLTALNDYAVHIPLREAAEEQVIIATRVDGAPLSVRDKGPLWIMYPFDAVPRLRSELHYARAIWQLRRIDVE